MMKLKIFRKSFILLFICTALVYIMFIIGNRFFTPPMHNIETKLLFIQQQKDIAQKDFSFLTNLLKPQAKNQVLDNETLLQSQKEQDISPQIPLRLHAIINNKALINEKWVNLYDEIEYNYRIYIVEKITQNRVVLRNKADKKDMLYLEIFTTPQELFLHIM